MADPGVVDQNIQSAFRRNHSSPDTLAVLLAGHVQRQKFRLPVLRFDFFTDRASALFITIGDEDERAGSRKSSGNRCPDAGTGARDQGDFVLEAEHVFLSANAN